jgi:uncharacterized repeat protein (TIGR03803 family)
LLIRTINYISLLRVIFDYQKGKMKKSLFIISCILIGCHLNAQTQLWGMTSQEGQYHAGVIFSTDGSGNNEIVQHNFFQVEGAYPRYTNMTLASNGKLYGLTAQGGVNNLGVLFQFDPTDSSYTKKFDFDGALNGSNPHGSLIQATDGNLYGMTYDGGTNAKGVLFRFDPISSTFTKLLDFAGTINGSNPHGSLIQATDGKLYGMTYGGGTGGGGVLFQFDPSTFVFVKKVDFAGSTNGSFPYGSLVQAADGKLYGMTEQGGVNNLGVLFQFDPVTSIYVKKRDFAVGVNGGYPYGSLMQATDGNLYGMTSIGGTAGGGVVFQYNTASSLYTVVLNFGGAISGKTPYGSLMQASDGKFYGLTKQGGANNLGVLFQFDVATLTYVNEFDFDGMANGKNPYGSLVQALDGKIYGLIEHGGVNDFGVLFQFDPVTSTFAKMHNIGGEINGSYPFGSLMYASDGKLYGMTAHGGINDDGVIFQFDPLTSTYTKKFDFDDSVSGKQPDGALMEASDGKFYGMTVLGGVNNMGVLFQFDPVTSTYVKKLDFDGTIMGRNPEGALIEATDGKLYGVTAQGGINSNGVLFQFDQANSVYTKKIDFSSFSTGSFPLGSLLQATDGNLYGLTSYGGIHGNGVLFEFDFVTTAFTKKVDLDYTPKGGDPEGSLIQATDGMIYGLTREGGANGMGVLFQYDLANSIYTREFDFDGATNGSTPRGSLLQAANGNLYGLSWDGGANNFGVIFQFDPVSMTFTKTLDFNGANGKGPFYTNLVEAPAVLGISPSENFQYLSTYPNPFDKSTTIILPEKISGKQNQIVITDLQGRMVRKENVINTNSFTLDRGNLEAGIYFCTLISEGEIIGVAKIVAE